jgi:hypothetical protein
MELEKQPATSFDVAVQEDMQGQWIVEAIAVTDINGPVRQARFRGRDARARAHSYAARKYGLKAA